MARIKGQLIDRNRFIKRYSYVRAPKRVSYLGDKNLEMELFQASFNNEHSKEINFEIAFADVDYQVALTPRQTVDESIDSAAVNLSVDSSTRSETGFTIRASAPFTGEVDVLVVRVSG